MLDKHVQPKLAEVRLPRALVLESPAHAQPSPLFSSHFSSRAAPFATQPTPALAPAAPATAEQKASAEKAKAAGNQAMAKKDYPAAIRSYGEAIEHDAGNAVYWSNRSVLVDLSVRVRWRKLLSGPSILECRHLRPQARLTASARSLRV